MRSGTVYRLPPSAPRTAAIASSSPLLPTPQADPRAAHKSERARRPFAEGGYSSPPGLGQAVEGLLPTPQAADALGGRMDAEVGGRRPSGAKRSIPLATRLKHLPTPTGSDHERSMDDGEGREGGPSLPAAAGRLLPTPRQSDQNRLGGVDHGEGGPSLPGAIDKLLPTPSSWLGRRPENASPDPEREASRQHEGDRGKRSIELPDAIAKLLPTPTEKDSIGSRRSTARTPEWTSNEGTTLTDAALESSGASTAPRSAAGKSSSGGLRLSPSFVEWLMGAPDGWTDPGCPLSATEF